MSAEDFAGLKALREMNKEKRAHNREMSAKFLTKEGFTFSVLNDGAHIVISHEGETVDFWPGTGLWIPRVNRKMKHRGVRNLVNYLRR